MGIAEIYDRESHKEETKRRLKKHVAESVEKLGIPNEYSGFITFKSEEITSKLKDLSQFTLRLRKTVTAPLLGLIKSSDRLIKKGEVVLILDNRNYDSFVGGETFPVRIKIGLVKAVAEDGSMFLDTVVLGDVPYGQKEILFNEALTVANLTPDIKERNILPLGIYVDK